LQLVDYYLTPASGGSTTKTLVRVVTRNLLPVQVTTPDVQPLLTNVADTTIDFYDGTTWTDSWDSAVTGTMPAAIRFQVTLAGADPAQPSVSGPVTLVVPVIVTTIASTTAARGGASP
jgi:hypothetical protein